MFCILSLTGSQCQRKYPPPPSTYKVVDNGTLLQLIYFSSLFYIYYIFSIENKIKQILGLLQIAKS